MMMMMFTHNSLQSQASSNLRLNCGACSLGSKLGILS